MSKFYEVSDDTIKIFDDVFNKKSFSIGVNFQFIGNDKQKELVKITKVSDVYAFILEKDLLVSINETLLNVFDDEMVTILMEQEIDKVFVSIDTGKIKLIKPDLTTFTSLINKYGVEKVARANQVEDLFHQQTTDGAEEFSF
jgi:hypothetical protein